MREKYNSVTCEEITCGTCGEPITRLKPERTSRIDLNDEALAAETNLFYLCFNCRWVEQAGYGAILPEPPYRPDQSHDAP